MLWLERRVVTALAGPDDDRTGGAISEFVDSSFRAMPQHLRLGVVGESLVLGTWVRVRHGSSPSVDAVTHEIEMWEHHPIGVIRQYARLLSSLVIFAQQETIDA
jgi:hypothetical protein